MERIIENIKQAKALVKIYRNITLNDIKDAQKEEIVINAERTLPNYLTGFGNGITCILCKCIPNCTYCIYGMIHNSCLEGKNRKTYYNIINAKTSTKLRNAFRKRADHIESILIKLKTIKNEEN